MPLEEFIIKIYLMVEQYYNLVVQKPLRKGGYAPKLSDTEIICMELVGESGQTHTLSKSSAKQQQIE